jgi:hypothetical protein
MKKWQLLPWSREAFCKVVSKKKGTKCPTAQLKLLWFFYSFLLEVRLCQHVGISNTSICLFGEIFFCRFKDVSKPTAIMVLVGERLPTQLMRSKVTVKQVANILQSLAMSCHLPFWRRYTRYTCQNIFSSKRIDTNYIDPSTETNLSTKSDCSSSGPDKHCSCPSQRQLIVDPLNVIQKRVQSFRYTYPRKMDESLSF